MVLIIVLASRQPTSTPGTLVFQSLARLIFRVVTGSVSFEEVVRSQHILGAREQGPDDDGAPDRVARPQWYSGEISIPTESVIEIKNGKKVPRPAPVPGYILINMDMNENTWQLAPDGVTQIVGSGDRPTPLSRAEVERLLHPGEAAEQREKVKTTVDYQIGETVKVIASAPRTSPAHLRHQRGPVEAEGPRLHLRARDAGGALVNQVASRSEGEAFYG